MVKSFFFKIVRALFSICLKSEFMFPATNEKTFIIRKLLNVLENEQQCVFTKYLLVFLVISTHIK